MGVLRDLAQQGFAVGLRHPVLGLDFLIAVDARIKPRLKAGGGRRPPSRRLASRRPVSRLEVAGAWPIARRSALCAWLKVE